MPAPALTVGGTPLYPQSGLLDPSRPVYRPDYGNAGLLSQPQMDNLIGSFAGGLLSGYQVGSTPDANGRYFTPIAPSGTYTADPDQASTVTPNTTPSSGLSYRDYIRALYGPDISAQGGDRDVFLSNLLNNNAFRQNVESNWGASLDDPYDPSSDFWRYFQQHVGAIGGNIWQGRGEQGGAGGSPGGTGDAGQGGSDV